MKEEKKIQYIAIEPSGDICEDDEIDLRELFKTIWKYRKKILIFVLFTLFLTLMYILGKPNIYTSKTILIPKQQVKSSLRAASALASIAGIDMSGDRSAINIPKLFEELLNG